MSPSELWRFLPLGYLFTIAIEIPILFFGLSAHHSKLRRIVAGIWLTACTYPIVTLVLPLILLNESRSFYLLAAETFAPVAECFLFWLAFGKEARWRDFAVIVIANLASFLLGEVVF
ncbi:MAG TPA: hypothetical protein VJT69_15395 [Pyrinomonadaceae bacterium]|nr:hypothetical protein [Pyrinomonadaceae bacterium]